MSPCNVSAPVGFHDLSRRESDKEREANYVEFEDERPMREEEKNCRDCNDDLSRYS